MGRGTAAARLTCCPDVTSHRATMPSSPPLSTCSWSSAKRATWTGALCPLSCRSSARLPDSKICVGGRLETVLGQAHVWPFHSGRGRHRGGNCCCTDLHNRVLATRHDQSPVPAKASTVRLVLEARKLALSGRACAVEHMQTSAGGGAEVVRLGAAEVQAGDGTHNLRGLRPKRPLHGGRRRPGDGGPVTAAAAAASGGGGPPALSHSGLGAGWSASPSNPAGTKASSRRARRRALIWMTSPANQKKNGGN